MALGVKTKEAMQNLSGVRFDKVMKERAAKARIEELEKAQKEGWLGYTNYFENRLAELRAEKGAKP